MLNKRSFKLMLPFLIVFIVKCSEKTNPIRYEPPEPPNLTIRTIPVPEKMIQSLDSMVQRVVKYMNLVNSIHNYEVYLKPPDTSKLQFQGDGVDNPTWTSSWVVDSLIIGLTISTTLNYYEWEVVFTGTKNKKIYTYSNVIKISQEIDHGDIIILLFDIELLDFASWHCMTDYGSYTVSMSASEEIIGGSRMVISEMLNGSRELILWRDLKTQKFKAKWKPDGSGQWWTYDVNGQIVDSGNWS